jgi:hypothetical protein
MITIYSKGLKMYKTSYQGLSRLGATRQESIRSLVLAYNVLLNNKGL